MGENHKALAETEADRAAKRMDKLAYGADADAKKARDKQQTPFTKTDADGNTTTLNAHSFLADVDMPFGLPRRGTEIGVPDRMRVEVKALNHADGGGIVAHRLVERRDVRADDEALPGRRAGSGFGAGGRAPAEGSCRAALCAPWAEKNKPDVLAHGGPDGTG